MIKRIFPFYKTGWFYLFLVLLAAAYWTLLSGGFSYLNQFNLYALYKTEALQPSSEQVVRLSSPLTFNKFKAIERVLTEHPKSTALLIGQPSTQFIQKLATYLKKKPRQAKIIIASKQSSPSANIPVIKSSFFSNGIDWLRSYPVDTVKNPVAKEPHKAMLYSPFLINVRGDIPLIWRENKNSHLTLLGEIIRQQAPRSPLQLSKGWQLELISNTDNWPLGFNGNIIAAGRAPEIQSIAKFNNSPNQGEIKLIIFDDGSDKRAEQISVLSQHVLNNSYLYLPILNIILQCLLLVTGLYIIWQFRKRTPKHQAMVLLAYVLFIFTFQYYLATQQQWLEVMPMLVVFVISWAIAHYYQKDNDYIEHYQQDYEQLFSLAIIGFTQSNNIEQLQKLLAQTSINADTVSKIFDLAVEAHTQHNNQTADFLFAWIENLGLDYQAIKDRVATYRKFKASPSLSHTGSHKLSRTGEYAETSALQSTTPVSQENTASFIETKRETKREITTKVPAKADTLIASVSEFEEEALEQTMVITPGETKPDLGTTFSFKADKFGRYQVEGILGKGAMGLVYQGVDPRINRHVAIKTLQLSENIDVDDFDEAKQRFFREAETAGNLSHANIVTIYDVGEEGLLGYIAMDLLTGAPLSHFIKPLNLLPPALVYQLMIQITDALDYAHRQNVVHRDIKPGNIIYDDDLHKVTVTDFGIAYVADNSKTKTGVIMGSPYYMSPEQVLGKQVDGRSDIFSLGATFYQLLSGCLPFEGESVVSVVYQITNEKHKPVTTCNEALFPSASRITNKAMHKNKDKRYQSMQEFKQALISALKRDYKMAPTL